MRKIGPKALKTQQNWGCKKLPCPFGHSTPNHRIQDGWAEAHTHSWRNRHRAEQGTVFHPRTILALEAKVRKNEIRTDRS